MHIEKTRLYIVQRDSLAITPDDGPIRPKHVHKKIHVALMTVFYG
jgi:hypothetical protein